MKLLIGLSVLAVITMMMGLFKSRKIVLPVVVLGLLGLLYIASGYGCYCEDKMFGMYINEHQFLKMFDINKNSGLVGLIMISGLLITILAHKGFNYTENHRADMHALMLFSMCGAVIAVSYTNLLMLFLGIEIMSIPLYIMAGSNKHDSSSNESGLKYFLLGAFATGFLLFGLALIYGATGSFNVNQIYNYTHNQLNVSGGIFKMGIVFTMVGLVFKIGAAPFHFWTPDVYSGAPSIITSFMSTVVKIAGFGALIFFFNGVLHPMGAEWGKTFAIISAATMILGNVTAVYQISLKRMLAWSSVAHAGYLLMTVAANGNNVPKAVVLYLAAYSLASIATFAVLITTGKENFEDYNGLGKRNKWLAIGLTISLLSLAGVPPLAGFMGKYYLFTTVYEQYPWLVIVAICTSAISIYYYLKTIIAAWFKKGSEDAIQVPLSTVFVILVCILGLIALGLMPQVVLDLA